MKKFLLLFLLVACPLMADEEFVNNRAQALEMVKKDGLNLQYVSWRLTYDKDLVLTAIEQNPMALEFASAELQDSDFVVNAATAKNPAAMKWASSRIQRFRQSGY